MFPDFFFIPVAGRFLKINFRSLLYLQGSDGGTKIITLGGAYQVEAGLSRVQQYLPTRLFCQVHDIYLVALSHIISLDQQKIQLPGAEIPLGAKYMRQLQQRLNIQFSAGDAYEEPSLEITSSGHLQRRKG